MRVSLKSCLGVGLLLAGSTASSVAVAGSWFHGSVSIEYGTQPLQSSWAFGQVGAARNSGDSYQEIGCQTVNSSGNAPSAYCFAQDAQSNYLSCTSVDPGIVAAARSVGVASVVEIVEFGGTCANIIVSNSSANVY
jgi:hypothetical protein